MRTILTSIHILLLLLRASTQIINNAQPGYMPYYQPQRQYYDEYDYRRWGPARGNRIYRRGGGKFPEYSIESNYEYDRYRKCKCSCKSCENIRPCCVSVCVNCNPQSNLVFVPYPVPLVVTVQSKSPSNSISTITTTTTTKAPSTTTRTTSPTTTITVATVTTYSTPLFPKSIREKSLDQESDYEVSTFPFFENKKLSYLIKKKPACLRGRCKLKNYRRLDYIDGNLNNDVEYNRDIRQSPTQENDKYYTIKFPSRSNWEPQFGIIPIPDKLALKFMTHLRDMKLQNLEKENVKPP